MCDFSLQSVRSRPAKVGDKLVTRDFGTGTRGFAASDDPGLAVCVLPGTELAFAGDVACLPAGLLGWKTKTINHQSAIFRQVNKDKLAAHCDALEFPDGRTVLLTLLCQGQEATVLQLPARPTSAAEADAQKRVTYVGWSGTEVQDRGPLYPIMKESDIMGALVEAEERTKVA